MRSDADVRHVLPRRHGSDLVTSGLYLVPFAGIAFLWFMAAIRTLAPGTAEHVVADPAVPPASVRRAVRRDAVRRTALVGAVALLTQFSDNPVPSPDIARTMTSAGYGMVFVFGVRAAGMFLLTTTTMARSAGLMSTPLAIISYVAGVFLLVSTTFHPAVLLVFPGWVLLVSVLALVRSGRLKKSWRKHDQAGRSARTARASAGRQRP